MLEKKSSLAVLSKVLLAVITLTFSGCYTIKTVSPFSLNEISNRRTVMYVHSDDSLWIVNNYLVKDKILTATIYKPLIEVGKSTIIDIYVAPPESVIIEGEKLMVPTGNIGKADYPAIEPWKTYFGAGFLLYLITSMLVAI